MKHKWILALLLLAAVFLLSFTVSAEQDAVDRFAQQLARFEQTIQVPVRDFDTLMKETFQRYPELYYYYESCSYLSGADGLTLTVTYRNTDKTRNDYYVVDSLESFKAAVGLCMCDYADTVDIIATNYIVPDNGFQKIYDDLNRDYYLIAMGSYSISSTNWRSEDWQVALYRVKLKYWNDTPVDTIRHWRKATERAVLDLASTLFAQDMPDARKALLIHDYIVDNSRYNMDDINIRMDWVNHVAYGILVEHSGVCQSYAEAARLLFQAAGIECFYVTGTGHGENHAWNCIQLDGEWYMMDTTWDDPVTSDGSDVKLYDYFNITSNQLRADHAWNESDYPVCTSTALGYDAVRALVDADTTVYTDYSASNVRTEAIERAELLAMLGHQGAPDFSGDKDVPVQEADDQPPDAATDNEAPPEPPTDNEDPADEKAPVNEKDPVDGNAPADEKDPVNDLLPEVLQLPEKPARTHDYSPLETLLLVLAIMLATVIITVVVVRCVANSRVMAERHDRKVWRDRQVSTDLRRRRRRF